ncbi:hypothetical protein SDJN02_10778, partial [Cucurbita argyrosperma subsp. argyrosperma]
MVASNIITSRAGPQFFIPARVPEAPREKKNGVGMGAWWRFQIAIASQIMGNHMVPWLARQDIWGHQLFQFQHSKHRDEEWEESDKPQLRERTHKVFDEMPQ